jgi:hypothetical protein
MTKAPSASSSGAEAKGPERQGRERDQRRDGDRVNSADFLRKVAERKAARDGAEIGDDGDPAHRRRIELVLFLQEGRVEILRAVAEEIEAHH